MRITFLLAALLLLSVNAISQKWKELPEEKMDGKITWHKLADENSTSPFAMLYFYREHTPPLVTPMKKMPIFVNDTLRYELKGNSMVSFKVYHKGSYKISGDKKDNTAIDVKIEPGKEYFFNCFMPSDIFTEKSVTAIKPEVARKVLGMAGEDAIPTPNKVEAKRDKVITDTLYTATIIDASFPGGPEAWQEYLTKNLKTRLIRKYIELERKETSAIQVARVIFTIDKDGTVIDAIVANPNDVHPKLAEEAVRIIKASPKWMPASQNGKNVIFKAGQEISFEKFWN